MSSFKALGATAARVTALEPVAYSKSDLPLLKPKAGVFACSITLGDYHHRHHHHYRRHQCQQQQQQQHYASQLESQQRYSSCLSLFRRQHHQYQSEKQHVRLLRQAFFSTFVSQAASTSPKSPISAPGTTKLSFSSSASSSASAAATSTTTTATPDTANVRARSSHGSEPYGSRQPVLNWNEFLLLRRRRRVTGLVLSIMMALASTGTGLLVTTSRDLDAAAAAAMGLDPIIVLAIGTLSFAGIGWLSGPFVGNVIFAAFARRRGVWKEFIAKDRAFLHRIRARRVDPSGASIQNPVPDYYGEKIGSVADYRRWLKDQRAFNLKRGDRVGSAVAGSAGTAAESAAKSAAAAASRMSSSKKTKRGRFA